ncbi:hypothetical protein K450DRAFT_226338 [Umbelopsis ramanniana AG]|uniref:Uncharacterized protein n=1 Tax=Umbelopsis ramanniana AG TaxID=1314678 RepID=A0AAD5EG80_UMBRA|nr:uncharacterized protein K450DRAFT_226338 [Umbelopsis ramanniana AG]KAI8582664.1 hypothetical protein K450DRAFT_226338 [Umbelopsis ramanniana AG]
MPRSPSPNNRRDRSSYRDLDMPDSRSPPPPSRRRRRSRSTERGYNDAGRSSHRSRSPRKFSRERQRDRGSPDRRDTLDGTQGHGQGHQ